MKKPIKTNLQMIGLAYIIELALLVCAMLFVYGFIRFDLIAQAIFETLIKAVTCLCPNPFCPAPGP